MLVTLELSIIGLELAFGLVLLQLNLNKIKFNATKNIMETVIVNIIEKEDLKLSKDMLIND